MTSLVTARPVPHRAIILAAGLGSRLSNGHPIPKPLRKVAGVPLIIRIIRALEAGGVSEVGIVVGHLGDELKKGLAEYPHNAKLSFFQNDEYEKPNGTSALKARDFVTGPTFLLMSDHLWSPQLLSSVGSYPIGEQESLLGVDYRIGACFDLDDATKVRVEGDQIVAIGKELPEYDALDTGLFLITPALMDALDAASGPDGCSLSEGIAALAAKGRMRVVDVGEATWIDVDTPAAHAEAERLVAELGDDLGRRPPRVRRHSRISLRVPPQADEAGSEHAKKALKR